MQVQSSYDLIVIGDQISGFFTAAAAAQEGWRVLLIEGHSVPSANYEIPSGRFLGELHPEVILGLQEGSPVNRFFKKLGLYDTSDSFFERYVPGLQFVSKKHRLELGAINENLNSDLIREIGLEPSAANGLAKYLQGKAVTTESFAAGIERMQLPVYWEKLAKMSLATFGSIFPKDISYPKYKELIDATAMGTYFPKGGRSALKEHLISKIQVFGGMVKRGTWVEELVFEGKKLSGVVLSSFEGFVRAPMIVGAMGADTLMNLVPEKFRSAGLKKMVGSIEPNFWQFSFCLTVPELMVPKGMGPHFMFLDDLELQDESSHLQVQIFGKEVFRGIPPGHLAMNVRTLIPFQESARSPANLRRIILQSADRLQSVMPFLDLNQVLFSPNPNDIEKDPILKSCYSFPSLLHIPPLMTVYATPESLQHLDWTKFGLPGIALCSRDLYPHLGSTGEVIASMDALSLLQAMKGKG